MSVDVHDGAANAPTSPWDDWIRPDALTRDLSDAIRDFRDQGFARLGPVFTEAALGVLRERARDLMLGRVQYEGMFFQLDTPSGNYRELVYGRGYEGPSENYRKIEKLEKDPLFLRALENPVFEGVARQIIDDPVIVIYRALLMTKAATGGTHLPWHQDAGQFWGLDRDPELQIWTALDDAPIDAGCVEFYPGSHKLGIATPLGGVVPPHVLQNHDAETKAVPIAVKAGESVLIHNLVWHRSGVNVTGNHRRAFSVCYMPGSTRCTRKKREPRTFFRVFDRREG
jgi:phytanoyl-CoA hydroxylase